MGVSTFSTINFYTTHASQEQVSSLCSVPVCMHECRCVRVCGYMFVCVCVCFQQKLDYRAFHVCHPDVIIIIAVPTIPECTSLDFVRSDGKFYF